MRDIGIWPPLEGASTEGYIEAFQSVFNEYLHLYPEDERKGEVILDVLNKVSPLFLYLSYQRQGDSKEIMQGIVSFLYQKVPDEYPQWLDVQVQRMKKYKPITSGIRSMIQEARVQGILPLSPET